MTVENCLSKISLALLLVSVTICSLFSEAMAFPLRNSTTNFKSRSKTLSYLLSVPGKGKFRFKLKAKSLSPKLNLSQSIILYSGTVYGKNLKSTVAAALIKSKDKYYFSSNFYLPSSKTLKAYRFLNRDNYSSLIGQSADGFKLPCQELSRYLPADEDIVAARNLGTLPHKTLKIAVDTDAYWQQIFGDISREVALAQLNEAEVLLSRQLNIKFEYISVNNWSSAILNPDGSELNQYREYKLSQTEKAEADVYYLLSGKVLSSGAIGVAYLASICRSPNFTFGIATFTNPLLTPITIAHEFGHNLGAQHAPSDPASIMSPVLGFNLETLNFSDYSISQINSFISTYGLCLDESVSTESNNDSPLFLSANLDNSGLFIINLLNISPQCQVSLETKRSNSKANFQILYTQDTTLIASTLVSFLELKFKGKIDLRAVQNCAGAQILSNQVRLRGFGKKVLNKQRLKRLIRNFQENLL